MKLNGIMIDCSRLMERHEYYYQLIDFMFEWHQNTLVFHFTDDYGCAIQLESLPGKARYGAFTVNEMKDLIAYANKKNIQVIPELETFGHTRYITDTPEYEYLYAGTKSEELLFNAVDPLNPDTFELIENFIKEISGIFTVFDTDYTEPVKIFLQNWLNLHISIRVSRFLCGLLNKLDMANIEELKTVNSNW